jgi:hypothetical protein
MQLRRQYLYFCASKASKIEPRVHVTHDISVLEGLPFVQLRRQYLYLCASKANKIRMYLEVADRRCQYLYCCTSKASKLST